MNKKPDKKDLLGQLANIAHEWHEIGLELQVEGSVLNNLESEKYSNILKLDYVIQSWMDTMSSDITWQTIINAIGGRIVNNKATTNMIRNFLAQPNVFEKYSKKKDFNGPMDRNL